MHEHLASFTAEEGVVFIGRAQEKNSVFRTEKRRNAQGRAYPWIVRSTGVINQFSVYAVDAHFGPFFLKFSSYFPYNAKLCLNGHEWAKRQAATEGIGCTALDNGSPRSTTWPRYRRSATGWDRRRSTRCCGNGWRSACLRCHPEPGHQVPPTGGD